MSVIIPVYNGARFLADALASVRAQTYRPFEILLIDDGSSDGSRAVAEAFEDVRCLHQSQQGLAAAGNVGIHAARGEFIAFLDVDDLWEPDKLSVQMAHMRGHPEAGYSATRSRLLLADDMSAPPWLRENLLTEDHAEFTPSALLIRKQVFEQIGDFDARYDIANDLDWLARAQDAGLAMAMVPQTLLSKRLHGSNLLFRTQQALEETLQVAKASIDRKHRQRQTVRMNRTADAQVSATRPRVSAARPRVSAIIPVYDGARYLGEAIESALAQTYRDIEVIVVDDGSTDDSARVAQQFGDAVHYIVQEHRGASAARNRGVEAARGSFFAFLDADDVWLAEKTARQLDAFDANPGLDMLFGHAQEFHSPELDDSVRRKTIASPDLLRGYVPGAMLVRRDSFSRVGMFDTGLVLSEFIDWYIRAREAGLRDDVLPEVVLRRRIHESNSGILRREARLQYTDVLKAALDRRRAARSKGKVETQ